jgi:hypothetical protein
MRGTFRAIPHVPAHLLHCEILDAGGEYNQNRFGSSKKRSINLTDQAINPDLDLSKKGQIRGIGGRYCTAKAVSVIFCPLTPSATGQKLPPRNLAPAQPLG